MKAHIFGTSPFIPDAAIIDSDEFFKLSGGNTGNLVFCHAISRIFNTDANSYSWGSELKHLNKSSDRLVVPLANQLGSHVDLAKLADVFSNISIPLIGVGLGAQGPISGIDPNSIPDGSWKWLKAMISNAPCEQPNISLRGELTLEAIRSKGMAQHCIVTGCPSNFINPSNMLGREIYRRRGNGLRRIAVVAGNPFLPQFRILEQSLVKLMESNDGVYICQHPLDMVRLSLGENISIERNNMISYRDYINPTLSEDKFLEWFRRYSYSYSSVPEWILAMKRFDVVVGTRIHGVMAGIQAGVPSVCLCIDSRTLELCQTMGIPYLNSNDYKHGISLEIIESCLKKWDWNSYDDMRQILAKRFDQFSSWNGLVTHGALHKIIKLTNNNLEEKKKHNRHQQSNASIEDRYKNIFLHLERIVDLPNPKILSYGCSDGYEPNDLAGKYFHNGFIVGCEIDSTAIKIAKKNNRFPNRVKIIESTSENLEKEGLFNVVIAMSVLCLWPQTKDLMDISKLYPFEKFDSLVDKLVSMLQPEGILCIYNSNYSVNDSSAFKDLEVIDSESLPKSQQVKLFDKTGRPLESQLVRGIIYKKKYK